MIGFYSRVNTYSCSRSKVIEDGGSRRAGAYFDLVDDVEGVLITGVREDDAIKGVGQAVRCGLALKGIMKVCMRLGDARDVAAENNPAGDGDEDECQNLDNTNRVGEPV